MKVALHGASVKHCNVMTEIRLANECGYDALEFLSDKLFRYLDNGGTTQELKRVIDNYGLEMHSINTLLGVGRYEDEEKKELMIEAERMCQVAQELECPTILILGFDELDNLDKDEMLDIMTQNISEIADIGEKYGGIRFEIELVSYTKFNKLSYALEVIERIDKDNVGLVIDFWHLHAAGHDSPEDVAKIDKDYIFGVHLCDGRRPVDGEPWEEEVLRNYMAGEGEVDIPAWVKAVKQTVLMVIGLLNYSAQPDGRTIC